MKRVLLSLGLLLLTASYDAQACNVPAFRYALERWPADPYQVLVYCEGNSRSAALDALRKGGANLSLRRVDPGTPEGKALAAQRNIAALPWVEVLYPTHLASNVPLWSGPLTKEAADSIVGSPARSALAKRLLAGEVAVWVLVKSGHDQEDSRALQTLERNLQHASATLTMPEIGTDLDGNPVEVKEFKTHPVHFGVLEVARDDPREKLLVNALLQSEADLAQQDVPMAFPVFGRGRALYALVGPGIQDKNIMEACQSMLAWCSCEIKAQNPGTDLLIAADWSRPYGGRMVVNPDPPPLTGVARFRELPKAEVAAAPAACPLVPPAASVRGVPATNEAPKPLARNLLYLAGGAGLALAGISVFLTVKMKK